MSSVGATLLASIGSRGVKGLAAGLLALSCSTAAPTQAAEDPDGEPAVHFVAPRIRAKLQVAGQEVRVTERVYFLIVIPPDPDIDFKIQRFEPDPHVHYFLGTLDDELRDAEPGSWRARREF